jgi:hypothetical protein
MQKLTIASDGQFPTYAINLAGTGDIYTCALQADTDTTLTVPSGARVAIFGLSSGSDYWVSDSAITIPVGTTFSASRAMQNPPPLNVTGVATLHFRAPSAAKISVAFYS